MATTESIPTITISKLEDRAALYRRYPRQNGPQDCYIALDIRDGEVWASYNAEIGNAVPVPVWNGLIRRYPIAPLLAETANALMDELAPLFARVLAGAEDVWNGSNTVGLLDDDALIAEQEITERCYSADADLHWWDADEWLRLIRRDLIAEIRAGASIEDIAKREQGDGREDSPILDDLNGYLEELAAEARGA